MRPWTPERWRRIEKILDAALDLQPAERSGFLERSCSGDAELRESVAQLLRACDSSEHFLERPVAGGMAPLVAGSLAAPDLPAPGARVGAYRIVHEAGRGGMGVVYLAERDDGAFRKRVALKLVRRAPGAGDPLARRFQDERQILASLEHPGIARLLDGGALEDGRPYYVMEYVEGTPIDRFCDEHRLDIAARLELFCQVCDAVQHAHRHQIIHRDLKPSNILVTSEAAVKLLDFGIATLLAPDAPPGDVPRAGAAHSVARILTPAYASPEQMRGEAASAASDVYSLGIILHELLTGRHPVRSDARSQLDDEHSGDDDAPPELPSDAVLRDAAGSASGTASANPPSHLAATRCSTPEQLHAQLVGELDRIVVSALRRDPKRRYASVSSFTADVRRHLAGPAAGTRRRSRRHGAGALVRRHRTAAFLAAVGTAAAAIAVTVVATAPAPDAAISPSVLAVFPFTPVAPDTLLQRVGRALVPTLSASLDGLGALRALDAPTILGQTDDARAAPPAAELPALARRLGAGMVIRGSLVRAGTRVRVDAVLLGSARATPLGHVSVTAAPHDIAGLTDSLTWALLRQLAHVRGVPTLGPRAVNTRSLPALRAYLEGERLSREYRMREAAVAFDRAVAADSAFWLAYWRGAWARELNAMPVDSVVTGAYVAHRAELPAPDQLLIEARTTEALDDRRVRLEALVARFPAYTLGWFELGELLVRRAPFAGSTIAEAEAPFRRAVSLDDEFVPAWDRLLWVAIARRDTVASARALAALTRLRYDSTSLLDDEFDMLLLYRHLHHLARTDGVPAPALAESVTRALDSARYHPSANGMPDRMQGGIARFGFHGARADLAARQLRSGVVPPAFQWMVIANSWAARGAWDSALVAADRAARASRTPAASLASYRLAAIGVWLGAVEPAVAGAWRDRAAALDRMRPDARAELAWVDGLLAAVRRDRAALARAREALRLTRAPGVGLLDSSLSAFAYDLAGDQRRGLDVLLALERDRHRPSNGHPYRTGVDRITASRWLSARGDAAAAARLLTWHEAIGDPHPQAVHADALLAPFADLARARILEESGQRDAARTYYERFLASYDAPVPAHRALVEEAGDALRRTAPRRREPLNRPRRLPF